MIDKGGAATNDAVMEITTVYLTKRFAILQYRGRLKSLQNTIKLDDPMDL